MKTDYCTCEWDDDGDGESGPTPYIAEIDFRCPFHGLRRIDGDDPWTIFREVREDYARDAALERAYPDWFPRPIFPGR